MRYGMVTASIVALAAAVTPAWAQVTIYENDFELAVNPPGALGTWDMGVLYDRGTNVVLGGGPDRGFWLTESPTLTFTGLAPLGGGTVAFRIWTFDTWDPGPPHCCGPDVVRFRVDGGPFLLDTDFGPGDNGPAAERFFDFSFPIPAGAGTLSLEWLGATTQTDEHWGIDNVSVQVRALAVVPEPATWTLVAGGVLALGAARRRRARG